VVFLIGSLGSALKLEEGLTRLAPMKKEALPLGWVVATVAGPEGPLERPEDWGAIITRLLAFYY